MTRAHRWALSMIPWLMGAPLACSRPNPPTLVPESATVTAITPAGVELRVVLEVTNPNSFALSAHAITAHVILGSAAAGGSVDLGSVSLPQAVSFPAQQTTPLTTPLSLPWADLMGVATLAAASKTIPYAVEGSLAIGGSALDVTLPYHLEGTVSQAALLQAALKSGAAPGLFPLPTALPALHR